MSSTPQFITKQLFKYLTGQESSENANHPQLNTLKLREPQLADDSPYVTYDNCQRAYWKPCPRHHVTDGEFCYAPIDFQYGKDSRCLKYPIPKSPQEKEDVSTRCNVKWPCQTDCEALGFLEDFSQPCPKGWSLVSNKCTVEDENNLIYNGDCIRSFDSTFLNGSMKMRWARQCDVSWPCMEVDENVYIDMLLGNDGCQPGWTPIWKEQHNDTITYAVTKQRNVPSFCLAPHYYSGPCSTTVKPTNDLSYMYKCGIAYNWLENKNDSILPNDIQDNSINDSFCSENPAPCPRNWILDQSVNLCLLLEDDTSSIEKKNYFCPLALPPSSELSHEVIIALIEECSNPENGVYFGYDCAEDTMKSNSNGITGKGLFKSIDGPIANIYKSSDETLKTPIRNKIPAPRSHGLILGGETNDDVIIDTLRLELPKHQRNTHMVVVDKYYQLAEGIQTMRQEKRKNEKAKSEQLDLELLNRFDNDEYQVMTHNIQNNPVTSLIFLQEDSKELVSKPQNDDKINVNSLNMFDIEYQKLKISVSGDDSNNLHDSNTCNIDWDAICPADWTTMDSGVCQAPKHTLKLKPFPYEPCRGEEDFSSLTIEEKRQKAADCGLVWPHKLSCDKPNLSSAFCPVGWQFISGKCYPFEQNKCYTESFAIGKLQSSAYGKCRMPQDFRFSTPAQKLSWAKYCREEWPCDGVHYNGSIVKEYHGELRQEEIRPEICVQLLENDSRYYSNKLYVDDEDSSRKNENNRITLCAQDYLCHQDFKSPCPFGFRITMNEKECQILSDFYPSEHSGCDLTFPSMKNSPIEDKLALQRDCGFQWPCVDGSSDIPDCVQDFGYNCPFNWEMNSNGECLPQGEENVGICLVKDFISIGVLGMKRFGVTSKESITTPITRDVKLHKDNVFESMKYFQKHVQQSDSLLSFTNEERARYFDLKRKMAFAEKCQVRWPCADPLGAKINELDDKLNKNI